VLRIKDHTADGDIRKAVIDLGGVVVIDRAISTYLRISETLGLTVPENQLLGAVGCSEAGEHWVVPDIGGG
jgi:hypothetical protein